MQYLVAGLIISTLFLSGCDKKEVSTHTPPTTTTQASPSVASDSPKKEVAQEKDDIEKQIAQALTPAQEEVAKKLEETNKELSERLAQTAQEGNEKIQETLEATTSTLMVSEKSAPQKANACATCHGAKGEKVALGRSKILNEMTFQEIKDSLLGYQEGTYGGAMKAMMQTQVRNLTKEEIEALAQFYAKP